VLENHDQGVPICPPLQPIEKHCKNPQHAVVSAVDNELVYPFLIHNLSFNASVVPCAQHDPQFD